MRKVLLTCSVLLLQSNVIVTQDEVQEPHQSQKDVEKKVVEPIVEQSVEQSISKEEIKSKKNEKKVENKGKDAAAVIPVLPEPTADLVVEIPEQLEAEEPVGVDTVALEDAQGNWLFKRIWWERAEERYGKIRSQVNTVWESRINFFVKRNDLDRNVLDPFYLSIGVSQGELQVILNELNAFFEEQRELQGDLNEQERALYEILASEQDALKQLRLDVESIAKIDHAIDDALGVLMDQINRVRQFEKQAWENFKEIAHVLSDTKARELYYMMDGAGRNIKNISVYLEQPFMHHFTRLIDEVKKHVSRVQKEIQSLKEKGVDFKRQVDKVAQQEEQERRAKEAQEEAEQEEMKAKPKKQTWFGWIVSWPKKVWDFVVFVVTYPYELIFGKK